MISMRTSQILVLSLLVIGALGACSKGSGSGGEGGTLSDQDLALANEQRFGEGNIPQAQRDGLLKDIHFAFDSTDISPENADILKQNAAALTSDSALHAEVEGHCDRRGTNEYNMALGEERAKSVARMLVSFGVKPQQLSTISYGEEIPLSPSDSEDSYAQNRRAHFAVYKKNNEG